MKNTDTDNIDYDMLNLMRDQERREQEEWLLWDEYFKKIQNDNEENY